MYRVTGMTLDTRDTVLEVRKYLDLRNTHQKSVYKNKHIASQTIKARVAKNEVGTPLGM